MRKAVGAHLEKRGFWIFSEYRVYANRRTYVRLRRSEFEAIRSGEHGAIAIMDEPGRTLWAVNGEFYWDTDGHTADEVDLIAWDRSRRKEARMERLRKIRQRPEAADRPREPIPEAVRIAVWRRDGGRCVRCGADEDLQFDHIIPVARGGATNERNIQLLCGDCNRLKADFIA